MTLFDTVVCILLFGGMTYAVGHSFIGAFFARKEAILNRMLEKGDV